jgi:4-amino-4-deoxy-L-arabinose transferase-like glycosyltransferase
LKNQSSDRIQFVLVLLLSISALSIGLSKGPFLLEEPRRAIVALEMLISGNFWIPTIHGENYFNKPPLFNWLVAGGFKLFGIHEWVPRAITLLSHLAIALLIVGIGKSHLKKRTAYMAASLYLIGADILFYFSFLGEIDIFFSLLIVLAWFGFYHYAEKDKFLSAFLMLYVFSGLAFLTKGLPALIFVGLSLMGWFTYTREWKKLFSWQHACAVLVLLSILLIYLYPYWKSSMLDSLLNTLWSQSSERAAKDYSLATRLMSLFAFPLFLLKDILPGSLLLLFFNRDYFSKAYLREHKFLVFCLLIFAVNILVYWISPGSRSRYIYMFHPLILLWASHLYYQSADQSKLKITFEKVIRQIVYAIPLVLVIALFVVPMKIQSTGTFLPILTALALGILLIVMGRRLTWSDMYVLIMLLLVLRALGGWIITEERKHFSNAAKDKELGMLLATEIGGEKVLLESNTKISFTTSFYLEHTLKRIVPKSVEIPENGFIILRESGFNKDLMIVTKQFEYQNETFILAKIKETEK